MGNEHVEHCKGYDYKVVRSMCPKLTRILLTEEKKILQDNIGIDISKMRLKRCKCKKCHEEFMLLKIDYGTYSYEQIYRSKLW